MRQREFIGSIGGAALPGSVGARAQPPSMPTIGFLHLASERGMQPFIEAFRSGLAALGYAEGKNIRVLYRFADGSVDRFSALAIELVSLGATIIVTGGATAIRAAHDAALNVPIVSLAGPNLLVRFGWAQTLARPGGMITGVMQPDASKQFGFEVLKEVLPQATSFGYLMNATNPGNPLFRQNTDDAARSCAAQRPSRYGRLRSSAPGRIVMKRRATVGRKPAKRGAASLRSLSAAVPP